MYQVTKWYILDTTLMPKEDQLILVQRIQQVIPDGDNKNYRHRIRCLDWQNVSFHIIKIMCN